MKPPNSNKNIKNAQDSTEVTASGQQTFSDAVYYELIIVTDRV